jgi:hypothetical protein
MNQRELSVGQNEIHAQFQIPGPGHPGDDLNLLDVNGNVLLATTYNLTWNTTSSLFRNKISFSKLAFFSSLVSPFAEVHFE